MLPKPILPIAFLVCAASASFAATVTFSNSVISPTDTTGSFLDNTGTLVTAYNFGNARTAPYTYNAPTASSNPDPNVTLNGITFTPEAGNIVSNTFTTSNFTLGNMGIDTGRFSNVAQTNTSLYGLVYDGARSTGNLVNMTLTLTNLTIGNTYELQMIYSELNLADNPAGNTSDRTVSIAAGTFTQGAFATTGTGSDGTTANLSYGPTTGAIIVKATFVATSSSELFTTLSNANNTGNSRVTLSGLVVTTTTPVPEPSTYGFAMAAILGAIVYVRNRKIARA